MTQRDVAIPTLDGTCDASLHTPAGTGPWPAVIMFPDAGGVRATFRAMAQQLADLGYAVLVPNFYYRLGAIEPFDMKTVFADAAERKRLMALVSGVSKDEVARDTGAMLDFLAAQPEVAATSGRHDRLHGRRVRAHRGRTLPDRVGGGVVPRRTDRQRGTHGSPHPAC
jgi:carboxymethylenebutenolidase